MDTATRELVRRRAGDRCEYCHMPQEATPLITFHVEHIVAKQHVDEDDAYKGTNLTSNDPVTKQKVNLFHPREEA